ncbi:MAG: hypothetical protein F6K31_30285 [Symploca sp. SIO2G7]|nr:hypothetical protein [Symploca sp. SIO2G7]
MAQAKKLKSLAFAEYLDYDDGADVRYDLLSDGELVPVPNESEINDYLAMVLLRRLSVLAMKLAITIVAIMTGCCDYDWKRQQYQQWGIPEYWIVDPARRQVNVLILANDTYEATVYVGSQVIDSQIFPSLEVIPGSLGC